MQRRFRAFTRRRQSESHKKPLQPLFEPYILENGKSPMLGLFDALLDIQLRRDPGFRDAKRMRPEELTRPRKPTRRELRHFSPPSVLLPNSPHKMMIEKVKGSVENGRFRDLFVEVGRVAMPEGLYTVMASEEPLEDSKLPQKGLFL